MGVALAVIGTTPAFAEEAATEASVAITAMAAQDPAAEAQPVTEASEAEGDDIVVTGYRASLQSAVNTKKCEDQVVESI